MTETEESKIEAPRVGVQDMPYSDGSTSDRLRSSQLLALAGEIDPAATERTLEHWRHQGLLPHPERSGQDGKKPIWTYPPETAEQLRALLHWRSQTKDPNVLRTALWYDGYPVETARVRKSIRTHLIDLLATFEKDITKRQSGVPEDPAARWHASQAVARVLARKRGKRFPHLGRQALDERTAAIALMLGLLLNDEMAMRQLEADSPAVERLIGVDRGRRCRPAGAGPWLDGPPEEGLSSFVQIGSLARLITVTDSSTDRELEVARDLARTLLGGVSAFSRIADAVVGRDNASGMAGMRVLDGDPLAAMVIVPFVLSILSSAELAQNLGQVLGAIQSSVLPLEQQAKELAALSEEERSERLKNLSELPFIEQVRIKTLDVELSVATEWARR